MAVTSAGARWRNLPIAEVSSVFLMERSRSMVTDSSAIFSEIVFNIESGVMRRSLAEAASFASPYILVAHHSKYLIGGQKGIYREHGGPFVPVIKAVITGYRMKECCGFFENRLVQVNAIPSLIWAVNSRIE
jgi:hypothetical protein